jgi:hypothetical protein
MLDFRICSIARALRLSLLQTKIENIGFSDIEREEARILQITERKSSLPCYSSCDGIISDRRKGTVATEAIKMKTTQKAKDAKTSRKPAAKKRAKPRELSANELTLEAWKHTYAKRDRFGKF